MDNKIREPFSYLDDEDLEEYLRTRGNDYGKCASCRFWNEDEGPTWESKNVRVFKKESRIELFAFVVHTGECRRHSPKIHNDDDKDCSQWPGTNWNYWCGDYEQKTEKP